MNTELNRRGRPRKPADERRDEWIRIRVTRDERCLILALSGESGKTLSEWARERLLCRVPPNGMGGLLKSLLREWLDAKGDHNGGE